MADILLYRKRKVEQPFKIPSETIIGINSFSIFLSIILNIVLMVTKIGILGILGLIPLVLMIIGIINAANNVEKPLPLIGKIFEDKFSFIG